MHLNIREISTMKLKNPKFSQPHHKRKFIQRHRNSTLHRDPSNRICTWRISCNPGSKRLFTRSPVVKKANTSGILRHSNSKDLQGFLFPSSKTTAAWRLLQRDSFGFYKGDKGAVSKEEANPNLEKEQKLRNNCPCKSHEELSLQEFIWLQQLARKPSTTLRHAA